MAASKNDLLMEVGDPGTATTLSAPGYTVSNTSINVGSTTNWPTATGVTFAIDEAEVVNSVEVQVPGTYNEYVGTVATGTSITNVEWARGVGDRNYSAGPLTRVYVPVSAERENRIVEWGLVHGNQDGTLKNNAVITAAITDGAVTSPKVATGFCVQQANSVTTAVATGTTLIPVDDTIPQSTEGDQYMTVSITPKSASNILEVTARVTLSNSVQNDLTAALFQDSGTGAIAASSGFATTATGMQVVSLTHTMVAGSTSATTFKIRAGGSVAGTTTFNGRSGARVFGAISKSSLIVREYKA